MQMGDTAFIVHIITWNHVPFNAIRTYRNFDPFPTLKEIELKRELAKGKFFNKLWFPALLEGRRAESLSKFIM